jgi:hypothetical protein
MVRPAEPLLVDIERARVAAMGMKKKQIFRYSAVKTALITLMLRERSGSCMEPLS